MKTQEKNYKKDLIFCPPGISATIDIVFFCFVPLMMLRHFERDEGKQEKEEKDRTKNNVCWRYGVKYPFSLLF